MNEELLLQLRGPKFYLENFTKIKGKKQGSLIPFILKEAQKDLFNTVKNYSRIVILKARQLGFSTAMVGYFYHDTIMNPGTTTAIIGYNSSMTAELLDKVHIFYKTTPDELKPTIHYNSKYEISFPKIDSKILVLSSSDNVGRGYTLNNVLATELSSWEKADEKMITLEASVPIDGKMVVESCVTGDTIVFTSDGLRFVRDIHEWDKNKKGFSEGKEILIDGHYGMKKTNTYYNSGVRKGYRIKTKCGFELGMSSVHKVYVLKDDSLYFVKAKDLKIGDIVPIKSGQDCWGKNDIVKWNPTPYGYNKKWITQFNPKNITEDLAYLLGIILGDGYIDFKQERVAVTTMDDDVSNFLFHNGLGLKFYQSRGEDSYHYICKNSSFVEFLSSYIKWDKKKAREKVVPSIVLTWSKKNVVAFLQGLFDADGHCRKDRGTVVLTSTSRKIISTVQVILLNFGIIGRIYSYTVGPSERIKVSSHGYTLDLGRYSETFMNDIGFRIKRKQNNKKKIHESYSCLRYQIPGIGKVLKDNMKELGFRYLNVQRGLNKSLYSKSGDITYRTLGRILDVSKNKDSIVFKNLYDLYKKKYFYDEIVSIEEIEENVYDFTVPEGNTVTYSGIVGHQTPKGIGNCYHRMWMSEDNGYVKKKYGWWWEYTQAEIELIRKRMNNPEMFAQEYELKFLTYGRSVFDMNIIVEQYKNVLKVGDKVIDEGVERLVVEEDKLRIYKRPKEGEFYVAGVDVGEGVMGGDNSVCTIWNRRTGEEVAVFRGLLAPEIFGEKLNKWGRIYNNALMVVEINNHGLTTITALKNLIYPSIYFRPAKFDQMGMPSSNKMGWKTTKMTRPLLIDDFAQAIRDKNLTIHSKELLDEMSVFIYNDSGDMQPQSGFHDDCIFSGAIAVQGFKVMYHKKLEQLNYEAYLPTSFAY